MLDKMHEMFPDKPILITENGSYSDLGVHGAETEKGTEEWHAANFRAHWDQATARSDYLAGYTFWLLKDYKERLGYNMQYNGISVMGLLGFDSTTRRVVYDAFKEAQYPR
jgi:beta-glucuronidase